MTVWAVTLQYGCRLPFGSDSSVLRHTAYFIGDDIPKSVGVQAFIGLLGALCAVLAAGLLALCNACRIERAADDVIADAGQILDSSAADENGAVLLKIVTFAGNVNGTFLLVGQSHPCDLTKRRVGLLGRSRRLIETYAALLMTILK